MPSIGRDSAQGAIGAAVGGTSLVRSHWLVRIKGCGQPYSCGDSWCFSESKDCVAAVVKVQVRVVFQPVNHTGVATAFTIYIHIYNGLSNCLMVETRYPCLSGHSSHGNLDVHSFFMD